VLYDYGNSSFTLRFLYPEEIRADVEAALWAWESFGGLGGRTRRGFGSIVRIREGSASLEGVRSKLSEYQDKPRLDLVPSLAQARLAAAKRLHAEALDAWKAGLKLLQTIRQGPGAGRNPPRPGTRKPAGRSRWPEPDEIRRLTRQSAPLHSQPEVTVPRFPRAAFGMPIVFHFHPGSPHEPGSAGDPGMKPLQLQPEGSERFASPMILRPVPDGQGFRTLALALSSDVPTAKLVAGTSTFSVDANLTPDLAASIPALCRNGKAFTSPIDLFLEELQK
jgi:CRISPR-associated protein Cmr1